VRGGLAINPRKTRDFVHNWPVWIRQTETRGIGGQARFRILNSLDIAWRVMQPLTLRKEEGDQMTRRTVLAICTAILAVGASGSAAAQDAAETAGILSGTGPSTGGAQRAQGSAVSNSLNSATQALRSARSSRSSRASASRSGSRSAHQSYSVPADVDFLEGTDAPTYRLGNGSSIRVSGGLIQTPETACVKDCPEENVP